MLEKQVHTFLVCGLLLNFIFSCSYSFPILLGWSLQSPCPAVCLSDLQILACYEIRKPATTHFIRVLPETKWAPHQDLIAETW